MEVPTYVCTYIHTPYGYLKIVATPPFCASRSLSLTNVSCEAKPFLKKPLPAKKKKRKEKKPEMPYSLIDRRVLITGGSRQVSCNPTQAETNLLRADSNPPRPIVL